jgi:ribosomal protein S6
MTYELFYLVGENKESKLDQIKEDIKKIVSDEGGQWTEPQILERRKMAYKIKGQGRGVYVAQRFNAPENNSANPEMQNIIQRISKLLNLYPDILRYVLINAAELPELKPREITQRPDSAARQHGIREERKAAPASAPDAQKTREPKSIDEKLEEILNI